MASKLTMKRNDTARHITDQLLFDGAPIPLAGATVSFLMRRVDGSVSIKKPAVVTVPEQGRVLYTFLPSEISVAGLYLIEWEVILPGSDILTVPDDDHHRLQIIADLG